MILLFALKKMVASRAKILESLHPCKLLIYVSKDGFNYVILAQNKTNSWVAGLNFRRLSPVAELISGKE